MAMLRPMTKERLLSKIIKDPPSDCWIWRGDRHNCGEIPKGFSVCHHCDNPPCCNPDHLFVAKNADNIRDAGHKGRMRRGTKHYRHRFTESEVLEIASLKGQLSQQQIARRFGVIRETVREILDGSNWSWLTGIKYVKAHQ
jgi:hypothetical protein